MTGERPYFTVPDHMDAVVRDCLADYIARRRASLQAEMNAPETDHRRRDVLAGALAELDYLIQRPTATGPKASAKPRDGAGGNLYR